MPPPYLIVFFGLLLVMMLRVLIEQRNTRRKPPHIAPHDASADAPFEPASREIMDTLRALSGFGRGWMDLGHASHDAPFVPSSPEVVTAMVALSKPKPGERWVDLGSGDGRVLLAAAREGAQARGYEVNPSLVALTRKNILLAGLSLNASVHQGVLWEADIRDADIISFYLMPPAMARLQEKLRAEAKPGCRIVSNTFSCPGWEPSGHIGHVWLYMAPPR